MPAPVPDPLAQYSYQLSPPVPPRSSEPSAVDRAGRLDRDVQRRSKRQLYDLRVLFRGRSSISRKLIHKVIDFVARDDPDSLPACARVSRRWNSRARYHLKIMFHHWSPISRLPIKLLQGIIDFVAKHDPDSLPTCTLVSRRWNSRARYHLKIMFYDWLWTSRISIELIHNVIDFVARDDPEGSLPACALVSRLWSSRARYRLEIMFYNWSPISRLPTELLHKIIDLVARDDRDSLPRCALVSRLWNSRATYHLQQQVAKTFRHAHITATQELRAFLDVVKKGDYFAQYPKSLHISPDPEASSTSYIPFLDLSSCTLPNLNRLILGEGLRWTDYPTLYHNGAVGSAFHSVTILDLSCRFKSLQSFFRAVRSFRNLADVRLLHPDPFFSIEPIPASQNTPHGVLAPSPVRLRKPLRLLEVPLSILPSVLEAFGDDVVNLFIRCPLLSVLWDVYKPINFQSSLLVLKTVELTVPTEPSNPTNHGLQRLYPLVISRIHNLKCSIIYSISLLPCCEHNTAGYRRELVSKSTKAQTIQILAGDSESLCRTCNMCDYEPHESPAPPIQRRRLPDDYRPTVWPGYKPPGSIGEPIPPTVYSVLSPPRV